MDSFPIAILRTEGKQNILRKTLHRLLDKIIPLGIFMQDTPFFGRSLDPPILSDPRLQIWELGVKITKPSIRNLPYPLETVSWKKWRSDLSKIEILSVDPEIWKETATNDYTTTFKTVNISEKSKWVMQVIDPPFINARWTGKFIEKDKGTTIIFEESIEIDSLPYRILTFLFLDLEKLMMTYLKDLTYSLKETWDEKRVKTTLE
jgi:hypothetical protein